MELGITDFRWYGVKIYDMSCLLQGSESKVIMAAWL